MSRERRIPYVSTCLSVKNWLSFQKVVKDISLEFLCSFFLLGLIVTTCWSQSKRSTLYTLSYSLLMNQCKINIVKTRNK